jgi:DNA-nicking Smr family endonuclease
MTVAELQRALGTDDEVVAWRREQLRRAGCRRFEAEVLARETRIDLHQAVELLERGCPSKVALNILL